MSIPEMYTRRQLNTMNRSVSLKDPVFRLLRKYFRAASNLYGVIPLRKLYEIIEIQNPGVVSRTEYIAFAQIARHEFNRPASACGEAGKGSIRDSLFRQQVCKSCITTQFYHSFCTIDTKSNEPLLDSVLPGEGPLCSNRGPLRLSSKTKL